MRIFISFCHCRSARAVVITAAPTVSPYLPGTPSQSPTTSPTKMPAFSVPPLEEVERISPTALSFCCPWRGGGWDALCKQLCSNVMEASICLWQPWAQRYATERTKNTVFCGHRVDQTRDDFDTGGPSKLSARVPNMTPGPRPGTPQIPEMLANSTPAVVRDGPDASPGFPKRGMQWALGAGKPPDHFPEPPCE
eukprot:gene7356-biopygen7545